ncbi:hypothetical protein ACFQ1L_33705 [Phytohabitans flavus]|uniref:hypothetical protein n=1 Tax=Phytohabitans flavus TaxID=1076124 RepID=UPI00363EEF65
MDAADEGQTKRSRPGPLRVAGAVALAALGVVALTSAVRFDSQAGKTASAERSPQPTTPHHLPDPVAPVDATATPSGTPTSAAAPTARPTTAPTSPPPVRATASSHPAPPRTQGPPPKPAPPRTSAPVRFSPVSVQAEDPDNTISGGARVTSCATCDGGARVRYLGTVVVYLNVPTAGTRTVTVTYEASGEREITVAINSAAPRTFTANGTSWVLPALSASPPLFPPDALPSPCTARRPRHRTSTR